MARSAGSVQCGLALICPLLKMWIYCSDLFEDLGGKRESEPGRILLVWEILGFLVCSLAVDYCGLLLVMLFVQN